MNNNFKGQQNNQPVNHQFDHSADEQHAPQNVNYYDKAEETNESQGNENIVVSDRVVKMLERQQNMANQQMDISGFNMQVGPSPGKSSMSSRISREFNRDSLTAMQDGRADLTDDSLARASLPAGRQNQPVQSNQHDQLLSQIGLKNNDVENEEDKQGDWQQFSNQFNQLVNEDGAGAADNLAHGSVEYGNEDINEGQVTEESGPYPQQEGQFENLQRGGFLDYVQEDPGEDEHGSNAHESQLKNGNDTIKEDLIENDDEEDELQDDYEDEDMLVRPSPEDREFFKKNLDSFQSQTSSQVRRLSHLRDSEESRDGSGQVGHRLQNKLGMVPVTEELNPHLEESQDAPTSALRHNSSNRHMLDKDKSTVSERYLQPINNSSGILPPNSSNNHNQITESEEDEPLFQLSIRLSADGEPEILKFYEGADPRQLAIDLQRKYPHVITSQKTVDLVERQIREGWRQVQMQIEQEQAEEEAASSGMLRSRGSTNLHKHRQSEQMPKTASQMNNEDIQEDEEMNSMDESITQQVFRHGQHTGRDQSEDETRARKDQDSKHVLIETPSSHHMPLAQKNGLLVKQVSEASAGIGDMPTDLKQNHYQQIDNDDYPMRMGSVNHIGFTSNNDDSTLLDREASQQPMVHTTAGQSGQELHQGFQEKAARRRRDDRSTSPIREKRLSDANMVSPIGLQTGGASHAAQTAQPPSPNNYPISTVYQRQMGHQSHVLRGGKKRAYSQGGPGSRLYYNALQMAEKKRKRQQDSREEAQQKEMEETSFKPQLITKPKTRHERLPNARPEDYLMYKMAERDRKLERLREQKDHEMMMRTNNFTPRINPNSAKIDKLRSKGVKHAAQRVVDSEEQGKKLESGPVTAPQYRSVDNLGSVRGSIIDIRNGGYNSPMGRGDVAGFVSHQMLPAHSGGPAEALSGGEENIASDEDEGGIVGAEQARLSGRDRFRGEAYSSINDGLYLQAGRQGQSQHWNRSQQSAGSRSANADRRIELYNMSKEMKRKKEASERAYWNRQNFTFQPNAHKYPEVKRGKKVGKSVGQRSVASRPQEHNKVRAGFTKQVKFPESNSEHQLGPKEGEIDDLAIGMFDGELDYTQENTVGGPMLGGTLHGGRPSSLGAHKKRYSTIQELEEEATGGKPDVWQRMEQRVEQFHLKKRREQDPEAFDQVVMLDQKTGKPLFKPQILSNRSKAANGGRPSIRDELDPRHINEYLYRHGQIMRMKKQMKEELVRKQESDEFKREAAGPSNNSKAIFERKLRGDLGAIFDQLSGREPGDPQDTARITARGMNRDAIPAELLDVFAPLINEMDQYGESLDRDEFIESSLVLLQSVNVHQRSLVMGYGNRKKRASMAVEDSLNERVTFKPKISETSKQLAKKFYERRQAQEGAKNKPDEPAEQSSERGKVDLRDPIKRFALNLEASKKEQEDLQRKHEEQLSERCTFQPNAGKQIQSGAIQSARSQYGNNSSRIHNDPSNLKLKNLVPIETKNSARGVQQAYDKLDAADDGSKQEKTVNSIDRKQQRTSKSLLNRLSENSQPRRGREGETSPAQVGGQSDLYYDKLYHVEKNKQTAEEVRNERARYYENQKKREEHTAKQLVNKLGLGSKYAPKAPKYEPRLRERRPLNVAQSVDAGDGRLLQFGVDKRSPRHGNVMAGQSSLADKKTPITHQIGQRSGASSNSNLHRLNHGSSVRSLRDEANSWQDASGNFKGMLRSENEQPAAAKKKATASRPGSSTGVPASTIKHMEQRAAALAKASKARQGQSTAHGSRQGSKKPVKKSPVTKDLRSGPGPKRKITAAAKKAGDQPQQPLEDIPLNFDDDETSPKPETRVPHPASGKRTAPQASPAAEMSPPLNRRSKETRDRKNRETTTESGRLHLEGGSSQRPDRQHHQVSELLIQQQFGKKSSQKDEGARAAAPEGRIQNMNNIGDLRKFRSPSSSSPARVAPPLTSEKLFGRKAVSPEKAFDYDGPAIKEEPKLQPLLNQNQFSARSAQSGGQAQDDEVEIAGETDREHAMIKDIPFSQNQLESLDNTQMSLDEILQQNQRYSLGANLGALVSDRSKTSGLVAHGPRFIKKSTQLAFVDTDRTAPNVVNQAKNFTYSFNSGQQDAQGHRHESPGQSMRKVTEPLVNKQTDGRISTLSKTVTNSGVTVKQGFSPAVARGQGRRISDATESNPSQNFDKKR